MSHNHNVKFWDNLAKKGAKQFERDTESYQKMFDIVEKYLTSDAQVLDFACGNGKIGLPISSKVAHVTGIDISSGMISLAEQAVTEQGLTNLSFVHGTLEQANFATESFDLVVASNILHLLDDPQSTVAQIHQLLKPGGHFISATAVIGERKYLLKGVIWLVTKLKLVPKIQYFTSDVLEHIIRQNFEIIEKDELTGTFNDVYLVGRK